MKQIVILLGVSLLLPALSPAQGQHDLSKFHHPKSSLKKYNYDSLYENSAVFKESTEGQELYEACLERYGGRELLSKRSSYRLEYEMVPTSSPSTIKVVKSSTSRRRYKIERWNHHGYETRTLNADHAWYTGMDTLMALEKGRHKAETFSYLTLTMPLGVEAEPFTGIRYGKREGDSLSYIYMRVADSLMIVIGIHPEDKTIRSSEGIIYQDDKIIEFVNYFSDFADFDGYLFAQKLTNISMGLEVAQSTLKKVEINPQFSEDEFEVSEKLTQKTEAQVH